MSFELLNLSAKQTQVSTNNKIISNHLVPNAQISIFRVTSTEVDKSRHLCQQSERCSVTKEMESQLLPVVQ